MFVLHPQRQPQILASPHGLSPGATSGYFHFSWCGWLESSEKALRRLRQRLHTRGQSHLIVYTADWEGRWHNRVDWFFLPFEGLISGQDEAIRYLECLDEELQSETSRPECAWSNYVQKTL